MTNLPKLPAGKAEIKVIMNMDTNGILLVKGIDMSDPDNHKDIVIKNDKNRFNQQEIDRMVEDAKMYE